MVVNHYLPSSEQLRRRGVTLLELLVVVSLLGIFGAVAMARYGRSVFGDFESQATARRLALALEQAKRCAIRTGDVHLVRFTVSGIRATAYQLFQRDSAGTESPVDQLHTISDDYQLTVSHTAMEFNFEGQAGGAYVMDLRGPNRSWRVTVIPISGAVLVEDRT